jgi:hypothetical protein
MHSYNDSSGRHHEESGRRSANVFILIYFFLTGAIITNGLNAISVLVAMFLATISRIGYQLAEEHSKIARMHYYRNRLIRDHIDRLFDDCKPSLAEIFDEGRKRYQPWELHAYDFSRYHRNWARVHQLFFAVGVIVIILGTINQISCFGKDGCFWSKGSDSFVQFLSPARLFIGKLLAI